MTDESSTPTAQPSLSARFWSRLIPGVIAEPRTRHGMVSLVSDAVAGGAIDAEAALMLQGVLDVADIKVRDIMVPRAQMVVLPLDVEPEQTLKQIVDSGHSRFPVVDDDRDDIDGILLAKDVLRAVVSQGSDLNIKELLRPVVFVPESKRLNVLLREFRENRNHMAIVVDEYGGVSGLITIEDVLEQIVGEIDDEHDVEGDGADIVEIDTGRYAVNALTDLDDFNDWFKTRLKGDDVDTIGGYLMQRLGRMPRRGETIRINDLRCKITRADGRRVHKIQVQRVK